MQLCKIYISALHNEMQFHSRMWLKWKKCKCCEVWKWGTRQNMMLRNNLEINAAISNKKNLIYTSQVCWNNWNANSLLQTHKIKKLFVMGVTDILEVFKLPKSGGITVYTNTHTHTHTRTHSVSLSSPQCSVGWGPSMQQAVCSSSQLPPVTTQW